MTSLRNNMCRLAATALLGLSGTASNAAIIYVNDDAPLTNGDGTTWARAARHLSYALSVAQPGDEIWVAAGTYRPDTTVAQPVGSADRAATFTMKNGVKLLGGFAGTEAQASQRNPAVNATILSADIGVFNTRTDNSYTIVTATNVSNTAQLDGFTLRLAQRDGNFQTGLGGAIYVSGGQGPVVNNCTFESNFAFGGSGMGIYDTTGTIVTNCRFLNNDPGTFRGGGIDALRSVNMLIADCVFQGNTAYYAGGISANEESGGTIARCKFTSNVSVNGGGIFFAGFSTFTVRECIFRKNECKQLTFFQTSFDGGAVKNWCTGSRFINCLFVANSAQGQGGAFIDSGPSGTSASIINCTFFGNYARDGGTVAATSPHTPTLVNSILWANTKGGGSSVSLQGAVSPAFSAMEDPVFNLPTLNPMFVDADGSDNILGNDDDNFQLSSSSPYRDTGSLLAVPTDVTVDLAGNARVLNGDPIPGALPDFGAYEYITPPPPFCPGDADRNGFVNFLDITTVLANFGTNYTPATGPGDSDNSGFVNFTDITQVLAAFGNVCGS